MEHFLLQFYQEFLFLFKLVYLNCIFQLVQRGNWDTSRDLVGHRKVQLLILLIKKIIHSFIHYLLFPSD